MSGRLIPRLALFALLAVLQAPRPVAAADHSVSYSLWVVSGNSVLLRYTVPKAALQDLVPAGWPAPATATVADYLLKRITVQSAAGACPAMDQGYDIGRVDPLAAAPGLYSFEILYGCPDTRGLMLANGALFDRTAHTDFARVQLNGGPFVPVLFTPAHQQLRLADAEPVPRSGAASYLRLGAAHVLHDPQGACLLLAVALLLTRRRELLGVLAGLALGYLIATALAAANLASLRPAAGAAWTGVLVVCLAALLIRSEALAWRRVPLAAAGALLVLAAGAALRHQPLGALLMVGAALFAAGFLQLTRRMSAGPLPWLIPIALFGLVDGFELNADWDALQINALMPAAGMVAFNTGVLLGNVGLCAAATGALWWLRRSRARGAAPLLRDLSAAALAGLGMFWLVSPVVLR